MKFWKKFFNVAEPGTYRYFGYEDKPRNAMRYAGTGRIMVEQCPDSYQENLVRLWAWVPRDAYGVFVDRAGNAYYYT